MATEIAPAAKQYKVVGTRPIRHDAFDKVTGKALYGADVHLPSMIHGKMLRSPHAHARIRSIDTSDAEARPEVKAVVTHMDLGKVSDRRAGLGEDAWTDLKYLSNRILAEDKVLFKGHPVAAVAAPNPHVAEEALALIKVEYEVLPSVTNVEDAMKPDAPILHEHITTAESSEKGTPQKTNVAQHVQHKLGNIDSGFRQADQIEEREFRTKTVHQGFIEPQNATALWEQDGRITIWCSSQTHFGIRDSMASLLGVPESKVKVVPMEIGGGFGGKLRPYLEPVAALLSKKSGRPVKMTMTRAEVLEATGPTSGSYVRVRIGVTQEGRITAAHAYFVFESGAYPGSPLEGASAAIFAPYDIENVLIDAYGVVDNKPATAAYRAPGAPIVVYAVESMVDEIAQQLGMDPIDFRILNAAKEGTRRADGVMNGRIGAIETMQAVKSHPHYSAPLADKYRGRGVAMGFCRNGTGAASLVANVMSNGTVSLVTGSVDLAGVRTALAQQLAEVLGIPIEDVNPQVVDTDQVGFTSASAGSGAVFKSGWAAYEAAQDVKRQMEQRAARIWDIAPDEVELEDGVLHHKTDPELSMTFRDLAGMLNETGGPVVGRANLHPAGAGGSYSANIVDVEVDPETGKVDLLRYTAFQDAGTAVHPSYVEGQIQGGTAQGVGWALNEEYFMSDDGHLLNSSFLDYRMPTALDLPMIDTVVIEVPNPGHPFGVRGVGEANIVPPLAAIANAIHDATRLRMRELPMSPGAVCKSLSDGQLE